MIQRLLFALLFVAVATTAACATQPLSPASVLPAAETPELAASELEARIAALEEEVAALTAGAHDAATPVDPMSERFQVAVAVYFMDNVGLHEIDLRLNEEGAIEAGDAGKVEAIARVLLVTPWPEELHASATELNGILVAYGEALANDDLDAAKPLATEVHHVGHALADAGKVWLSEAASAGHDAGNSHEGEHSEEDTEGEEDGESHDH